MKVKLGIIFTMIFALFIGGTSFFIWKSNNKILDTSIEDKLNVTVQSIESMLDEKAKQALAIGTTVSHIPEVVDAAKAKNREASIEKMVPIYEALKDDFYLSVLHLRTPYDTSFVRAQNPDNFGDTTTRQAIVDTGKNNESHFGFDQGPFGIGMRGWNPVTANGEVIGTMEVNIEFTEQLLHEIKEKLDVDLVVFTHEENDDKMKELSGTTEFTVDETLLNDAIDERSENIRDGNIAYTLFPIKSYEGDTLTVMAAIKDISAYQTLMAKETSQLIIYLVVLGVIFTAAVLLFLHITLKPMKSMTAMVNKVATGDLSENIHVKSKDEIGLLADRFNIMIESLRRLITNTSNTVDSVSSSSQELAAITEQNANSMSQLNRSTQEVHQFTDEQSESISSTTNIMSKVNDALLDATNLITDMSNSIRETSKLANAGSEAMETATVEFTNINDSTAEVSTLLSELEEHSKSIGKIIEIVQNIAEETNLLALNAAIEAARAGEEGKGFAVVADEVRKLAEHSLESTREIESFIRNIEEGTNKAMDAMQRNSLLVEHGAKLITEEATTFKQIDHDIKGVSDGMTAVLATTEEVTESSETIMAHMQSLEQVSNEIARLAKEMAATSEEQSASIEEVAASSETLAKTAHDMLKEIQTFKL